MNYLKHLGLRELPFGITPDTSYFFASRSIQEALNTLLVAVSNGEGFIKITGEVIDSMVATMDNRMVSIHGGPGAKLTRTGTEPATSTPEGLEHFRLAEIEKWRPIIEKYNIRQE